MRIHVISIGGRIMHTLAMVLQAQGDVVTGSDDEIYEPSKSKLNSVGLLPNKIGWDELRISKDLDLVVLGMHAKKDNPELLKAKELGLPIVSYPELIYQRSKEKKKVVVAGSHGKTTTTAMIMHVLKEQAMAFDFLVGAEIDGFDTMIRLSNAPLIVIEGDEYLSSPIDSRPKMLHYHPDLAIITGAEWDHINVFPTEQAYLDEFSNFLNLMNENGKCYFDMTDPKLLKICLDEVCKVDRIGYDALTVNKRGQVIIDEEKYDISVFGRHNLLNMQAAMSVCKDLGITPKDFMLSIADFKGASKRLQILHQSENKIVYRDFAHAPSKVRATSQAVKQKHKSKKIKAILELHTYSSLNQDFIPLYKGALSDIDAVIVYYNEHTLKMKNMPMLEHSYVKDCFAHHNIQVISSKEELERNLIAFCTDAEVLLLMSSGNYNGLSIEEKIL